MPGAVVRPGKLAGYARGRNRMEISVEHFTVGVDSTNIGLDGYFHLLFPKHGAPVQFAEIDALTWHAAEHNARGPGAEVERLGYHEPLTDDQVHWLRVYHHWLHDEWGMPLVQYRGPRFATQGFHGFVNHLDLSNQRSDGLTHAEFDLVVAGIAVPAPQSLEDEIVYMTNPRNLDEIWVTNSQTKRHVKPSEWQFAAFTGQKPLPVDAEWFDSIPEVTDGVVGGWMQDQAKNVINALKP